MRGLFGFILTILFEDMNSTKKINFLVFVMNEEMQSSMKALHCNMMPLKNESHHVMNHALYKGTGSLTLAYENHSRLMHTIQGNVGKKSRQ
jgi:hypothetical protein